MRPATPPPSQRRRVRLAGLAIVALCACSSGRSAIIDAPHTTPRRSGCTVGENRCNGRVPEVCRADDDTFAVTRWWPMHPAGIDGGVAECAGVCVVENGVASCSPFADGGAL